VVLTFAHTFYDKGITMFNRGFYISLLVLFATIAAPAFAEWENIVNCEL
jgi:hypothetical protein